MVAVNVVPALVVNNYVWQLLKNNTDMTEDNYGGAVPIVPDGDDMEIDLTQYNAPYICYGYAEDSSADVYAIRSGSLSYAVYSNRASEINLILNTIKTALEQHDDSAAEVNEFTSQSSLFSTFGGMRFGSFGISYFEGPAKEMTEGGRKAGIIVIRYTYFADYTIKRFKDGVWA